MHGVVFHELKDFVDEEYGSDGWDAIMQEADLESSMFMPFNTYPDEELFEVVRAAVEVTNSTKSELLTEFGEFAAPNLVERYNTYLDRDWSGLDVLEHTEDAMHKAVRAKEDEAEPPELECRRESDDEVVIEYSSDRQLCQLGEGLIRGVADTYGEDYDITQTKCMLENDSRCEIHVKKKAY